MRDDVHEAQLETTKNLIEYDSTQVVITRLVPKERAPDGSRIRGDGEPTTLDPQTLFFSGVTRDDARQVTVDGELITSTLILVGLPEDYEGHTAADFEENDRFEAWGRKFRVAEVHLDNRWERKAWVVPDGR